MLGATEVFAFEPVIPATITFFLFFLDGWWMIMQETHKQAMDRERVDTG